MTFDTEDDPLLSPPVSSRRSEMLSRTTTPQYPMHNKSSLWPLLLLLVLTNLATSLYTLPLNRVIELRLCQEHYNRSNASAMTWTEGTIPEKLCKIDEVQKKLAWLQGIMETTAVVCDFIVTIPFSFIAERFGVRVVLWCNLVPRIVLSIIALFVGNLPDLIPTKAIVIGPFFALLGGECVFNSTIYALTSALATEYVQRASYFSYISSVSYVIAFIGPSLASYTMSQALWLPFAVNITLLCLAVPIIRLFPDARKEAHQLAPTIPSEEEELERTAEASSLLPHETPDKPYASAFETPRTTVQSILDAVRVLRSLITGRPNFQILLMSFFLTALASSDTKLLVQYISKRYEWTFAEAGYLLSAKALVNIILLTLIIPLYIRKTSVSSDRARESDTEIRLNIHGAELSIAVSVVGVLCIALASRIWLLLAALIIYALGSALPIFTLSLLKSPLIALPKPAIQDFSIVMLVKTLGALVGAPVMAGLWVLGMRGGGGWVGAPFWVSGGVYVVAGFVVRRLRGGFEGR